MSCHPPSASSREGERREGAHAAPLGTVLQRPARIALVGAPNAGKTSIFNSLTGLRAKTGNYPGVTVARAVGTTTVRVPFRAPVGCPAERVTVSAPALVAGSPSGSVGARSGSAGTPSGLPGTHPDPAGNHPDPAGTPSLTQAEATASGQASDGVVPASAAQPAPVPAALTLTIEDLPGAYSLEPMSPDEQVVLDVLTGGLGETDTPDALVVVADATTLSRSLGTVAQALALGLPTCLAITMTDELTRRGGRLDVDALGLAIGVPTVRVIGNRSLGIADLRAQLATWPTWQRVPVPPPTGGPDRLSWVTSVLNAADYVAGEPDRRTAAVDRVLLHPLWGTLIFFAAMFLFFQAIFVWAEPFKGAIEEAFAALGGLVHTHLDASAPLLAGLLGDAVIGGVGGVLTFIPQILIMFLLIALMEGVGYMSRAAFLMDRIMASAGLEGRAFVALLSSFACAIPGIMATRTLPSAKDRLATMLAAPLMTCSARLPVYVIMISLLVGPDRRVGPFEARGVVMFGLYLAGAVAAMTAAWAVKRLTDRGGVLLPFYMEMPPYRVPRAKTVVLMVWDAVKGFLRKAGTIILLASVLVWGMLNVPARSDAELDAFCAADAQCQAVAAAVADPSASTVIGDDGAAVTDPYELATLLDAQRTSYVMDHSAGASLGKALEPVFAPLGFDWRVNVAVLSSLAARETFVATLGQIGAAADPEDPVAQLQAMTYAPGSPAGAAGEPVFSPATIAAVLAFFVFAMQCMATAGAIRRETGTWKWPAIAYGYLFALAWLAGAGMHALVGALT